MNFNSPHLSLKTILVLPLCILGFAFPSSAFYAKGAIILSGGGGHTIDNGGGLAELQMTKIWSNFRQIVSLCMYENGRQCGLNEQEFEQLKTQMDLKDSCFLRLKFGVLTGQDYLIPACGDEIQINSAFLYDSNKKPLSYVELLKKSLTIFTQLRPDVNESWMAKLIAAASQLVWVTSSLEVKLNDQNVLVTQRRFNRWYNHQQITEDQVNIETDYQLVNLNTSVYKKIKCTDANKIQIGRLSVLPTGGQSIKISGDLIANCVEGNLQRSFVFDVFFTNRMVDTQRSRLTLY